jgi:DNA-binding MurR/RpiR family transcriptional regulator
VSAAPELSADAQAEPPRDMPALRAWIVARHGSLPKRLTQVAEFTLAHPEEIAFGRLAEIAALAAVQPSTLVRFAQALGYSGFTELQAVFRDHARQRWPDHRARMLALADGAGPGDPQALLHGFLAAGHASLDRLRDTLEPDSLARAVAILAAARGVAVLGSRRSFPLAGYAAYALRTLGIRCELIDQMGGMAGEQAALLGEGDALLAISFTPYTPLTVELTAGCAQRGIPVVAVTDTPFSPLARVATVWLEVAEADHAGFRSLAGGFAVLTTLAVAAAGQRR